MRFGSKRTCNRYMGSSNQSSGPETLDLFLSGWLGIDAICCLLIFTVNISLYNIFQWEESIWYKLHEWIKESDLLCICTDISDTIHRAWNKSFPQPATAVRWIQNPRCQFNFLTDKTVFEYDCLMEPWLPAKLTSLYQNVVDAVGVL